MSAEREIYMEYIKEFIRGEKTTIFKFCLKKDIDSEKMKGYIARLKHKDKELYKQYYEFVHSDKRLKEIMALYNQSKFNSQEFLLNNPDISKKDLFRAKMKYRNTLIKKGKQECTKSVKLINKFINTHNDYESFHKFCITENKRPYDLLYYIVFKLENEELRSKLLSLINKEDTPKEQDSTKKIKSIYFAFLIKFIETKKINNELSPTDFCRKNKIDTTKFFKFVSGLKDYKCVPNEYYEYIQLTKNS